MVFDISHEIKFTHELIVVWPHTHMLQSGPDLIIPYIRVQLPPPRDSIGREWCQRYLLPTSSSDGHVLARRAASCIVYVGVLSQYHNVSGCICVIRRLAMKWSSDNSASTFGQNWRLLRYTQARLWIIKSRLHYRHKRPSSWSMVATSPAQQEESEISNWTAGDLALLVSIELYCYFRL
jgi:hypothetical protein